MNSDTKFDRLLLEAVDEALSSLGEAPKRAIYHHLEEDFHIAKPEIPHKIQAFAQALEQIFQEGGASQLQILMMREIHDKIGGYLEWKEEDRELTFSKYVEAVKKNFLKEEMNPKEDK
ncbi:MAG: hypothetical protein ACOC6G_01660 [Thermoproteota archaeon]